MNTKETTPIDNEKDVAYEYAFIRAFSRHCMALNGYSFPELFPDAVLGVILCDEIP